MINRREALKYCAGILPFSFGFNWSKKKRKDKEPSLVTHIHLYEDKLYDNITKEITSYNNQKWIMHIKNSSKYPCIGNKRVFLQHLFPNGLCRQTEVFLYPYTGIQDLDNEIQKMRDIDKSKKYDIIVIHTHKTNDNITKKVGIIGADMHFNRCINQERA